MNTQPLLSVIVPVYNVEQYLHQCVDSIIGQTYQNLEIILVNDGSTDGSGAICDDYAAKDSRVRVIHKENGGLSSARNAGLELSTGIYTSFIDSDDWLDLNAYENLISQLILTEADVISFDYISEFQDSSFKSENPSKPIKQVVSLSGEDTLKAYSSYLFLPMMPLYIYRNLKLEGLRCAEGKLHEDELFSLEYFASKQRYIVVSPQVYYHYRIRKKGSITSTHSPRHMTDTSVGFLSVLGRLQRRNVAVETLAWANYIVLSRLEYQYNVSTYNGVRVNDFLPQLRTVLDYTYTLPLPKDISLWEVKLFRKFPKLYCYFTRVYHPIARRLGVGRYAQSK